MSAPDREFQAEGLRRTGETDLTARDGCRQSAAEPMRDMLLSGRSLAVGLCKRRIWKALTEVCLPKADTDKAQCKKSQLGAKILDKANVKGFIHRTAHQLVGITGSFPKVCKKSPSKKQRSYYTRLA